MAESLLDYQDKVLLITGGATGIGRATARAAAGQGAIVVIGDVDPRAEETARLITDEGQRAEFVRTDVTSPDQVAALVRAATEKHGRLDVAFNNAGVLPPAAPLAEQSLEDWDRVMAVDLKGVFLCLREEIRCMAANGGGAIINTASIAGLIADPDMSPYVAAKHGVIGLTKAAAYDYAGQGIRVNAVAPGLVRTPMTEAWLSDAEKSREVLGNTPIGRAAEPEEIAGTVLFLGSSLASSATGAVFTIDGGQTAH